MKAFRVVLKILAALAMVAGVIYVIATYGDKISAWARKLLNQLKGYCPCCDEDIVEEVPVEEVPAQEEAVQAEEQDFEG